MNTTRKPADDRPETLSRSFKMSSHHLNDAGTWDVVVVGGGPSGCAAAVAAASSGARTLLIERCCALGGMGTLARVPAWCPYSDLEKQIHRGFAGRMLARSLASTPHIDRNRLDWVPISFEYLKVIYDEEVHASGAQVRFDTLVVDVVLEGEGLVKSLVVADKSGLHMVYAAVFVDCTGDADIVTRCGVDIHKGDDKGGELMPTTMCFTLANVKQADTDREFNLLRPRGDRPSVISEIRQDPLFAGIPDEHICIALTGPGVTSFNAGHIYNVDNTDPESISRGVREGRRLATLYRDGLAKYLPEIFGEAVLITTGSLLGVRETRRIIADYELTLKDYLDRRSFEDEICRNAYFIDIHLYSEEIGDDKSWTESVHGRFEKYKPGESHGIPYRSLCPKNLDNVLVAGRCIGTDRTVNASVRVMPVCLSTGEAAGVAAGMAVEDRNVHRVNPVELREKLISRGVYLP